jgi:hypothetical protein
VRKDNEAKTVLEQIIDKNSPKFERKKHINQKGLMNSKQDKFKKKSCQSFENKIFKKHIERSRAFIEQKTKQQQQKKHLIADSSVETMDAKSQLRHMASVYKNSIV